MQTTTYYPNKGGIPTVCSQFGYSESSQINKVITFDLNEGKCRNGRLLEKAKIKCYIKPENNMVCKHSAGYELSFLPVNN